MAQALWTTVHELRMAGVKSDQLKPEAFESSAKHAELRALLAAYEQFLVTNKRGDMATVYEEAVRHPDWCPIQPEDCWTELPDVIWTPLQRRLIDRHAGRAHHARESLRSHGTTIPRRGAAHEVDRVGANAASLPAGVPDGAGNAVRHRIPGRHKRTVRTPFGIALFHAGGREAEIEEVFRRILANGASLDQVEIACASDVHVALVWEKALRHEWPVTLGPGIPAPSTRPGRALIGFCDWIETDFRGRSPASPPAVRRPGARRREGRLHRRAGGADACACRGRLGTCDLRPLAGTAASHLRSSRERPEPVGRRAGRRDRQGAADESRGGVDHAS